MLDAIRYLVDNGIKWRAMPADFPPWDRVYACQSLRKHATIATSWPEPWAAPASSTTPQSGGTGLTATATGH